MKLVECLHHSLATHVVHGEPFPRPVHTRSQRPKLGGYAITIFFLPLPYLLYKLLPAQIVTILA